MHPSQPYSGSADLRRCTTDARTCRGHSKRAGERTLTFDHSVLSNQREVLYLPVLHQGPSRSSFEAHTSFIWAVTLGGLNSLCTTSQENFSIVGDRFLRASELPKGFQSEHRALSLEQVLESFQALKRLIVPNKGLLVINTRLSISNRFSRASKLLKCSQSRTKSS
ncbi:hypothetical protein B296_00057637 [Ensete ventricosum]|uniref:Uncharacterized protein n=1 Tax=Ensete ventricosum TaxID=4639 RepID=A0A426X2F4_ENSVE|nr:hypothetical protein B296_00057637 [Ensete ventricosum]